MKFTPLLMGVILFSAVGVINREYLIMALVSLIGYIIVEAKAAMDVTEKLNQLTQLTQDMQKLQEVNSQHEKDISSMQNKVSNFLVMKR